MLNEIERQFVIKALTSYVKARKSYLLFEEQEKEINCILEALKTKCEKFNTSEKYYILSSLMYLKGLYEKKFLIDEIIYINYLMKKI